jgi:hypothetical protein
MSTARAQRLISDFSAKKEAGVFTKITKAEVVDDLREKSRYPGKITQGATSLCGPAVFLHVIAKKCPAAYARYIIDLYQTGSASIDELKVVAGRGCKNYSPHVTDNKEQNENGRYSTISAADWIGLASLRDSENSFFNYDHHSDQFGGITLPNHLTSWFRKAGFNSIESRTNLVFDKGLLNLLEANRKFVAGHEVCLFLGARVLMGKPKGKAPADHWVVMTSQIYMDGDPAGAHATPKRLEELGESVYEMKINFKVFTWGNGSRPVNERNSTLTVTQFLDYYYGYVAVKK